VLPARQMAELRDTVLDLEKQQDATILARLLALQ